MGIIKREVIILKALIKKLTCCIKIKITKIRIVPKPILKNLLLNILEITTTPFQGVLLKTPHYNDKIHYSSDR